MVEDLVADDRVGGEDDQAAAFDAGGVRVGGVGRANEGGPLVADRLLGGGAADLVFDHQLLDDGTEVFCRTLDCAARFVVGDIAEVADELLREFTEAVGLGGHGIFNHGRTRRDADNRSAFVD